MITLEESRSLKLMADYDCYPLWKYGGAGPSNVNPASLPISQTLQDALNAWAERYDDTLNRDDPRRSGFPTSDLEVAFKADGKVLFDQLKVELGSKFSVILHV